MNFDNIAKAIKPFTRMMHGEAFAELYLIAPLFGMRTTAFVDRAAGVLDTTADDEVVNGILPTVCRDLLTEREHASFLANGVGMMAIADTVTGTAKLRAALFDTADVLRDPQFIASLSEPTSLAVPVPAVTPMGDSRTLAIVADLVRAWAIPPQAAQAWVAPVLAKMGIEVPVQSMKPGVQATAIGAPYGVAAPMVGRLAQDLQADIDEDGRNEFGAFIPTTTRSGKVVSTFHYNERGAAILEPRVQEWAAQRDKAKAKRLVG